MKKLSTFHEAKLEQKLEELYKDRQTVVRWDDLYLWYGVQKISSRTYRDLLERWNAYLEARGEDPGEWGPVEVWHKRLQGVYEGVFRVNLDDARSLAELAREG
jgi:hypothetical protein